MALNNTSLTGQIVQPRVGMVVTTWSHEDGVEYARSLPNLLPDYVPPDLEAVVCPTLLENERDIPEIEAFFAGKALDALCMIPGNFTLDHVMPLLAERLALPALLWGLSTREAWGALVGLQQTFFPFKELGLPYRVVMGELDDQRVWEKIIRYSRAAALVRRMKGLRVGLMGWRAQGMSDVVFDELALREVFGVQVVNVGLTRYTREVAAVPTPQVEMAWEEIKTMYRVAPLKDDVRQMGVRSYLAMKKLAEEQDLDAVTVECFHDHLGEPCLGCSLFNDAGLAASCEGDVPSAVVMLVGQLLTGRPVFHADIFHADFSENTAVFGHCGNLPRYLSANPVQVELIPAREFGEGFAGPIVQGTMKPGPVTAINLAGRRGNMRVCALQADVVPYEIEIAGSWAKLHFPFPLAEGLEAHAEAGYGHHFAIVEGHVGHILAEWCDLLGIDFMLLD